MPIYKCSAPHSHISYSQRESNAINSKSSYTQLPGVALGYYRYSANYRQYGTSDTIKCIMTVSRLWMQFAIGDTESYPFGIGDMSYADGRPMSPHASHRDGKAVDIRPIRKDRRQLPVSFTDSEYDREETQRLVNAFRAKKDNVDLIFFNDPQIVGVRQWPGHQNHLHVHFRK